MSRLLFVSVIVLLPRLAAAGALLVPPPIKELVRTEEQLMRMCAVSGTYDACTRFVAYRLEATCYETEARWSLDVSATFRPYIILYNIQQLAHEQQHISDVRRAVEQYLLHIANVPFESRGACEASAFTARETFGDRMRDFAAASNAALHPRAFGRPTNPLVTGTLRPASIAAMSAATGISTSARGRR